MPQAVLNRVPHVTKMPTDTQKLRVLRARTDQDLLVLLQRELDRGLALVQLATTKNSPHFSQAQKAYLTATSIQPRISGLSQHDWQRLDGSVKQLQSLLEQVPAYANLRAYPASFAS